jgi:hypothetical protein
MAVQALVRPEGVILDSDRNAPGPQIEVTSSHLLGHDNIVRARLGNSEGENVYVRVHHTFEVELKKNLSARIDPEYAFVYAIDNVLGAKK